MNHVTCLRLADAARPRPGATVETQALLGRWENADIAAAAPAIRVAEIGQRDGLLYLSMTGLDEFAWGATAVERVFAGGPASSLAVGLTASFELPQRRVRVHGNIKLGVMVLAGFVTFNDGSSRRPTFIRDFLYRRGAGEAA